MIRVAISAALACASCLAVAGALAAPRGSYDDLVAFFEAAEDFDLPVSFNAGLHTHGFEAPLAERNNHPVF